MRLDLVIPARNEAANIQDALRRLILTLNTIKCPPVRTNKSASPSGPADQADRVEWKVIVAVNGTTDDTLQRVEDFRKTMSASPDQQVRQSDDGGSANPSGHADLADQTDRVAALVCPGVGKGAAIRFAAERSASPVERVRQSEEDVFGFIDADLSADPDMIAPMVRAILADEADVVIGSRLMQTRTTNRGWLRTLSSKLFNLAVHLSLGLKVKDAQCGLKVMNARARELLASCQEDGWFLDIEFLTRASRAGLRIKEVPVPWLEYRYPDRRSQVSMAKDGLGSIKAMLRIRRMVRQSDN